MNEETMAAELEAAWSDIATDDETVTEEAAPETEEANPAEPEEDGAAAEEVQPEAENETDRFILKHLGEDKTVTREEMIPLAQKGMDYDRVKQQLAELTSTNQSLSAENAKALESLKVLDELAKQRGYKNGEELMDETRAAIIAEKEGVGLEIAKGRLALDKREKALAEKEAALTEKKPEQEKPDEATLAEERKRADILKFTQRFPDIKPTEIPAEVWGKVTKGESLVTAYVEHENAKLKAQILADKKNAENKERSTGSKSGVGDETHEDEFAKAFREA